MKTARIIAGGALAVTVGVFAWYWAPGRIFAAKLEATISGSSDVQVRIKELTPFSWESVVFLGPYTDPAVVHSVLGHDWPMYRIYGLEYADSFSLALFMRDGEVTNVAKLDRCSPDISKQALATKYSPDTAVFRVDSSNGCATLMPQEYEPRTAAGNAVSHSSTGALLQ